MSVMINYIIQNVMEIVVIDCFVSYLDLMCIYEYQICEFGISTQSSYF